MMKNFFKILLCQTLVFISEVFIHLKNCIDDCIYDCGCILKYQFIACHDIAEIKQSVCETSQHEIQVLNSAFFKLITTRIKTTSSKTGGEVGFSRRKVVIFPKKMSLPAVGGNFPPKAGKETYPRYQYSR